MLCIVFLLISWLDSWPFPASSNTDPSFSSDNIFRPDLMAIKSGLKILSEEKEGSVLLLAGKGHESNQEIKRKTIQSNDYEIVRGFI